MSQKKVQHIQVGDCLVRYQVVGEGDPVILVHGLSASTLWWRRNIPTLAHHYRLYLVDLPGFGSMHFPRARFDLADAASWLLKWMEAIGLKRAHFIGHSMGGYICMWLAAHHPEAVARLVLVAPAVVPKVKTIPGYFVPLIAALRYMPPEFLPILAYDFLRAGPMTLLRAIRSLIALDVREEIAAVTTATLLLWGENDTLVPLSLGYFLQKEIPHARLIVLQKAAHVCMFDRPRDFDAAVLSFLNDRQTGTTTA
ncbi:MAG: alpha/beta hydrolase [Chloroflexota bacterium]|nr:alpha/beta hydrolase [Chloroflexota bacterium]